MPRRKKSETAAKPGRRGRGRKAAGVKIDFSDIGSPFLPKNDYHVVVEECELKEGDKGQYFSLKFTGAEDTDQAGSSIYHNASCAPNALWRLKATLEALDMDAEDEVELTAEAFVGQECMISTYGDEYNGTTRVKVDELWSLNDEPEGNDEDSDDDEAEGGESCPEIEDLDDEQVKALAEIMSVKARGIKKLREKLENMQESELDEAWAKLNDDDEDDDDEGDEVTEEDINEMSEEELEEFCEENELEVDLSKHRTLRKKKAAVVKAARDEELID